MQLKICGKNVNIEDNKITGITGKSINDIISFNNEILNPNIYVVSFYDIENIENITVINFLNINKENNNLEEFFKILNLNIKILTKKVDELSTSEKIKILILYSLIKDYNIIYFDNIFPFFDSSSRTKLKKLIIKLKKFKNKTILISDIFIDNIFEIIDNLIFVGKDKFIFDNKYDIYKEIDINMPITLILRYKIFEKKKVDIGKVDSVNELIKAIYREVR